MAIPFLDIANILGQVIDRVVPDPQAKMDLQLQLAKLADQDAQREHDENMGQIQTNIAEANNRSVFVAGWRPFIGWGCGGALLYNTLFAPLFHFQVADLGFLQTILMAMLGLGAMRSYDKAKGTSNDVLPILPPKSAEVPQAAPGKKRKKFLGLF
jgi:hypothetical protein